MSEEEGKREGVFQDSEVGLRFSQAWCVLFGKEVDSGDLERVDKWGLEPPQQNSG